MRQIPTFASWLVSLVPANPIRAAADGAMLPLVVFALLFGLALGRVAPAARTPTIALFRGIAEGATLITGGPGRDQINADAGSEACNFLVCRGAFGNVRAYGAASSRIVARIVRVSGSPSGRPCSRRMATTRAQSR